MEDKLKAEKELISSLLVALPKDTTVSKFLYEYKQTEGRHLPIQEYGCSGVLEFFDMIRDTVTIAKQPFGEPILCVKVNESIKHIDKLVSTQKRPGVRRATHSIPGAGRQFLTRKRPVVKRSQPQAYCPPPQRASTSTRCPQKGASATPSSKPVEWQHFETPGSSGPMLRSLALLASGVDCSCQTDPEAQSEIFNAPSASLGCGSSPASKEEEARLSHQNLRMAAHTNGNIVRRWQKKNSIPTTMLQAPLQSSPSSMPIPLMRVLVPSQQSGPPFPAPSHWGGASYPVLLGQPHYMVHESFYLNAPTVPHSYVTYPAVHHFGLNPDATEYVPGAQGHSGVELQAEKEPERVDQGTSTADLSATVDAHTSTDDPFEGVLDDVSQCVWALLQEHPSGLEVAELLGLCQLKTGKDLCVGKEQSPLELAHALLASVSSISIDCIEPGKFVVRSYASDTSKTCSGKLSATIPEEVAHGLTSILLRYPYGLEAKELLNVYREHFTPHDYLDKASQDAASFARDLLVSLPSMTVRSKGEGTYVINLSTRGCQPSSECDKDARTAGLGSSLDESDTSDNEGSLTVQELPSTREFLVVIGEVFNPTEFYILNLETVATLESMMAELNKFYSTAPLKFYSLNRKDLKPGYLCAALYVTHGKPYWHRAIVTYVKAPKVCVLYVDYGTVKNVKIEELRRLRPDFMELPTQGIRASLANLRPKGSSTWSVEAKRRFLALTKSTELSCTIVEQRQATVVIELSRALDSVSRSIGDILVEEGLAERVPQYIESHRFADGYDVKMVVWNDVRYMTGGAISKLFGWEGDRVKSCLKLENLVLPSVFKTCPTMFVGRQQLPELYEQIRESEDSLCSSDVELYPVEQVPSILRLLQHPSKALRRDFQTLVSGTGGYSSEETTYLSDESAEEEEECYSILKRNGKRRDLMAKVESLTEQRRALRMRAYEANDKEALFQLAHVERQIGSVKCLLEEFDHAPLLPASRQSMAPSPASSDVNTIGVSRRNSGDRVQQQSVSDSLQSKLLQMLISAKRET